MNVIETSLPGVLILDPVVHDDGRGVFFESYNKKQLENVGVASEFVQDNYSFSLQRVLRGLHYQLERPQGKLVRVVTGEVFDVAVDIRRSSPSFGRWTGTLLSGGNYRQLWIPPGFAHGFLVLSDSAQFLYKTTDYWEGEHERCIIWNDIDIAIDWPLKNEPILSVRDQQGQTLKEAELYP